MTDRHEALLQKAIELEALIPSLSPTARPAIEWVVKRVYEALERMEDDTAYALLEQVARYA